LGTFYDPADDARRAMWAKIHVYGEPRPAATSDDEDDDRTTAERILAAFRDAVRDAEGRLLSERMDADGGVYGCLERHDGPVEKWVFRDRSTLIYDRHNELTLGYAACFCLLEDGCKCDR